MELEVHPEAVGACVVCGRNAASSPYWIGMTAAHWEIIRPLVEPMFKVSPWSGERLVQNVLFVPQLCKPLCGTPCSIKYKEIE